MTLLFLLPTVLAMCTLAAHYARYGFLALAFVLVASLALLLFPKRWVARTMQVILVLAAIEWVTVLYDVASERAMDGRDSRKSGFILGGTAAFTLAAAALYQTPRLKRRYASSTTIDPTRIDPTTPATPPAAAPPTSSGSAA